jgi:ABC-type antimicrobial peptide transport system permease subunit
MAYRLLQPTGLLVAIVAGGTIAYHSLKAARMDPVKWLRDE